MNNLLSQLTKIVQKKQKRIGRGIGSGRGSKSGRGTTRHQKARESIPLHFEGGQGRMVKKFPLLRGKGKNKSIKTPSQVIHLGRLDVFADNAVVDRQSLIDKKLLRKNDKSPIKILDGGLIKKKLIIRLPVSQSVKQKIEKLGGKIETK